MSKFDLQIPENELSEKFIASSGPGGQNVNKVATTVQIRFDVTHSPSLAPRTKTQLRRIAAHLMSDRGVLTIEASRFRTQGRNREDARARLAELIHEASKPPPPRRIKTRPGKGAVERRLKAKSGRGNLKKLRGKIRDE